MSGGYEQHFKGYFQKAILSLKLKKDHDEIAFNK